MTLRCLVTGNPCNGDTLNLGVPCFCANCSTVRRQANFEQAEREQQTITPEEVGEIDLFDGEG